MTKHLDRASPRHRIWRYVLGYVPLVLGQTIIKLRITGRQYIPTTGPYIVASNHFSTSDPFYVIAGLLKPVCFLMASDQEVEWHLAWAPWLYGYIPTDRKNLKPGTIKQALRALERKEVVGLFPEGDTFDNILRPPKRGAAYLSSLSGTKILPISVLGAENMWSCLARGVRPVVEVRIGRPFYPGKVKRKKNKKDEFDKIGDGIMKAIAALLPETRRGHYR